MRTADRRLRPFAVLVVIGVLTSGCGARWSDEERTWVMSRRATDASGGDGGAAASTVAGGTSAGPGDGSTVGGAPQSLTGGDAGDAGDAAGGPTVETRPCAASTTAPGVTDDTIVIGAINSLSGPVPGLGATYLAATRAYVTYRNATGGVCGRQISLLSADDGLASATYRAHLVEFDTKTLGVVTGIAGGGDGGARVAEERGIPMTGTPITPALFSSPVVFGMRPAFEDYDAPTARYTYLRGQGVRRAAVVFLNAAVAPAEADKHRRLLEAAGIQVVLHRPLPLATLSYDSTARAIVNSGADYVLAFLEQGGSAGLARALHDIDAPLLGAEYPVAYGSRFPELAGEAAEGASSWIDVLPVEDGGSNPQQAQLARWMGSTAPDEHIDVFASLAWAATKAFVDSVEALPGPITRAALLAQLRGTHEYDTGGLLGPIDLGAQVNGGCLIGVIYRNGAWRRMNPAEGFLC